jgi:hypothetical protein
MVGKLCQLVCIGLAVAHAGEVVAQEAQKIPLPLPLVVRPPVRGDESVFRAADLVLMVRIDQSCETEMVSDVGSRRQEPRILRIYHAEQAIPLRVNKRAADDPDLASGSFHLSPTGSVDL